MYAVIASGGKQHRVSEGARLDVELVGPVDSAIELAPVLLVDGDRVLATPDELKGVTVSAKVVGESRGPKINAFTYKSKSRQRRRWGHRQHYSTIEITGISEG